MRKSLKTQTVLKTQIPFINFGVISFHCSLLNPSNTPTNRMWLGCMQLVVPYWRTYDFVL